MIEVWLDVRYDLTIRPPEEHDDLTENRAPNAAVRLGVSDGVSEGSRQSVLFHMRWVPLEPR